MSKYSFILRYGYWRNYPALGFMGAVALAYVSLPYSVKTYLPPDTTALFLFLMGLFVVIWHGARQPVRSSVTVNVSGDIWSESQPDEGVCRYQITPKSRLFPFVIYLAMLDEHGGYHHRWVFPSQCEQKVYRRMARLIIALGRRTQSTA
ncbi:protein YgfX [Alteromonas sp. C1M14]|uniref:protein YgfX n=1 Tax=Alteromonas sp. C1M14 TaxID=2841567 RepID=UPI001C09EE76|nr:protein YgfX [Alteromonas sp. C1M14]MBU2979089.1 hypothetical protein [Alteromonas sp. C1M14]